jgi:predicted NUDIX family phosphoesterase
MVPVWRKEASSKWHPAESADYNHEIIVLMFPVHFPAYRISPGRIFLMTIEHILVIPTPVFHQVGHFQGFCGDIDRYLEVILNPRHASYRPRPEMEQDPTFKQLIPYCVFRCNGEVFYYQRGTAQGEARLHAKRSVGVGGHVSTLDMDGELTPYLEGMKREIEEEVRRTDQRR